jgi:hypothetical protein
MLRHVSLFARYYLLAVTAISFAALTHTIWTSRDAPWFAWGLWASLVLNFVFLACGDAALHIEKKMAPTIVGAKVPAEDITTSAGLRNEAG